MGPDRVEPNTVLEYKLEEPVPCRILSFRMSLPTSQNGLFLNEMK
jgi:hypothetical protein